MLPESPHILIAEDYEPEARLITKALLQTSISPHITVVENGEYAMSYLLQKDPYQEERLPHIVLLDLNMPRKDGWYVLENIQRYNEISHIPIVVFTSEQENNMVKRAYTLGANAFIFKPTYTFEAFKRVASDIERFWFRLAQIPT